MKKSDSVLQFLRQNPDFLVQHAEELGIYPKESKIRAFSQVQMQHAERQMQTMAHNMEIMTDNARQNNDTMNKIMRAAIALMRCNTIKQLLKIISGCLKNDFNLHDFFILLLVKPQKKIALPENFRLPENHDAYSALAKLKKPHSGHKLIHRKLNKMLPENHENESYLHLPLIADGKTLAVLIIAHPDPEHFAPDAPSDYVALLGEIIGSCLARISGYKSR